MRHVVAIAVVVLALVAAAEAAPPSNVGYRKLEIHDTVTGELYSVALWYPTLAAPAPLFLTASLSPCGLPAILCRLMAFEMPVAADAAPAGGAFGLVVISHGAGGMALNHRDLALALAARGYVVAAPAHPRGQGNDISGDAVWIGRPKQLARIIDEALGGVTVPVRLYAAERDDLTLVRYHAERLAKTLPRDREYVVIRGAGHFSFVAGFPTLLKLIAGEGARDPDGFDRDALHEAMNPEIVGFFDRKLPAAR